MEYLILTILLTLILWFCIVDIVNDRQDDIRYQEYIDSIKVGDIFEPKFVKDLDDDPFKEFVYSKYSKVIIDIKKNNKGETWVKYKRLNNDFEYTQKIHRFAKDHKRVKQSEI